MWGQARTAPTMMLIAMMMTMMMTIGWKYSRGTALQTVREGFHDQNHRISWGPVMMRLLLALMVMMMTIVMLIA